MRTAKTFLALLAVVAMATIPGCDRIYSYNFKDEGALDGWILEGSPVPMSLAQPSLMSGYSEFTDKGLYLDGRSVSCPFMFKGDFTYQVAFYLKAELPHVVAFGLNMGDGTWNGSAGNDLHIEFFEVGDIDEGWRILDHEPGDVMVVPEDYSDDPLLSLVRDGRNVFKLVKVGKSCTAYMNGEIFSQFELNHYESVWFAPGIEGSDYTKIIITSLPSIVVPVNGFFLESVRVTYPEGNIADTPLPI